MTERYWGYYGRPSPPLAPDPRAHTEADLAANRRRFEAAVSRDCEESRLKPCPKCGNRRGVRLIVSRDFGGGRNRNQRGVCDEAAGGCGLRGREGWSATTAEDRWNDPKWREAQKGEAR